ncbi:MAG: S9 family peptidase [Alphaproteobacteria bacterium]|nr:S9 family peptidase [Alphaproteobacteria bacterium]
MRRRILAAGAALLALCVAGAVQAQIDPPWLADIHGARALQWVAAQNAKSEAVLKSDPRYAVFESALRSALDREDRIPEGHIDHGLVYDFWQDASHVRGIWRRTSVADYAKPEPHWQLLLDLDALDAKEHAQLVWQGEDCDAGSGRCLVKLSPGGGDAATAREFDLSTRAFLPGGFSLSLSKLTAAYVDADHVLFGTDFGPGSMTRSSYPRILKLWQRGEPISAARALFTAEETDVSARPVVFPTPEGRIAIIDRAITFFTSEFFLLRGDALARLPLPEGAELKGVTRGRLVFTTRDAWTAPDGAWLPAGALAALDLDAFAQNRARFSILTVPGPHSSIDTVECGRDVVYAAIFTDVTGSVHAYSPERTGWNDSVLALPAGGSTSVVSADPFSAEAELGFESFVTPPTLYAVNGTGAPRAIRGEHPLFDPSALRVEQRWVASRDGVRIPYFLVAPRSAAGPLPTILYAYGGFEVPVTPWYFNEGHRPLYPYVPWLSRGGAIAIANIRGGGEFGPAWHEAALKLHRQRAFDDFEAVAEDLIRTRVAAPPTLGIVGASNGGLLVTTAMTQRPELFRAVVAQRPLIDMLAYTHYGAGASWIDEYGDPADPAMHDYIARYSPYQSLREGVHYPSLLLLTETSDDRVTPVFARAFAAKMESQHHDVLFDESMEGGHGPGATNAAQAKMWALTYTFFSQQLH